MKGTAFAAMAVLLLAAHGSALARCGDADFATDATRAAIVRDGAPRTHFVRDDAPDCPNGGPACRTRAFLVPGDVVLVADARDGFVCAAFAASGGASTTGWLPRDALVPDTANPADWAGRWKRLEADITITKAPGGALRVHGDATWGAGDPERVRNGGVHTGELDGMASIAHDVLAFTMGEGGTRPYDKGDETDCRVRMLRRGPYLVVTDNTYCGGANVSFTGIYRRRG